MSATHSGIATQFGFATIPFLMWCKLVARSPRARRAGSPGPCATRTSCRRRSRRPSPRSARYSLLTEPRRAAEDDLHAGERLRAEQFDRVRFPRELDGFTGAFLGGQELDRLDREVRARRAPSASGRPRHPSHRQPPRSRTRQHLTGWRNGGTRRPRKEYGFSLTAGVRVMVRVASRDAGAVVPLSRGSSAHRGGSSCGSPSAGSCTSRTRSPRCRRTCERFREGSLTYGPAMVAGVARGAPRGRRVHRRRGEVRLRPRADRRWRGPRPPGRSPTSSSSTSPTRSSPACRMAKPDGVLLALHGAMVTPKYPDADAEVLRRLRAAVGPNVPLAATLDFHGNVSPADGRDREHPRRLPDVPARRSAASAACSRPSC